MRIIAGEFRGRQLLGPTGDQTRPITDRVKQSLFDIIAALIDGSRVYDCFAGTGSMGLECLSRGAEHVTFFEADRSTVARLRSNIEALKVADRVKVVTQDLFAWIARAGHVEHRADLIFLDPPYRFLREKPDALLRLVQQLHDTHLAPAATLIFRHDSRDRLELPPLVRYDERTYGGMTVEFLRNRTA